MRPVLDLSGQPAALSDALAASHGARAAELDLSETEFAHWPLLARFPRLEALALRGNGLRALAGFPVLPALARLDLRDNLLPDIDDALRVLRNAAPALRSLRLEGNPVTGAGADPLDYRVRAAAALPELRELDGEPLSAEHLALARSRRSLLQALPPAGSPAAPRGGRRRSLRKRPADAVDELCARARVGDVLLFESAGAMPALQRGLLGAEVDHVGVVVRNKGNHGHALLEATRDGVLAYDLGPRIRAYGMAEAASRVVLRRLEGRRTPAGRKALAEFVAAVEGRPFSPSPLRLLRGLFPGGGDGIAEPLDAYFCSQLVAHALQHLGALRADADPSGFWPGSFAKSGGAALSAADWFNEGWRFWPSSGDSGGSGGSGGSGDSGDSGGEVEVVMVPASSIPRPGPGR